MPDIKQAPLDNWTDNGDGTFTLDEKFEYKDGHQLAVMPIGIRRKEPEARRLEALRPKPPKEEEPTPQAAPAAAKSAPDAGPKK